MAAAVRGRVRVFVAASVDGFIADRRGGIDFLPKEAPPDGGDRGYSAFMASVGCILMGRGCFDTVSKFVEWPYKSVPVLVASHRALPAEFKADACVVEALDADIGALLERAHELAGAGRDVYVDGGHLARQALDAGALDEVTVTVVPTVLGSGSALFAGCEKERALELSACKQLDAGLVQLTYRVARD